MNETTERFFGEISAQVGGDRVAEVHLFPAVRQGGMESGLAVVAAVPEAIEPEDSEDSEDSDDSTAPELAAPETATPTPPHRHVVYTARYRHTLKGPDRGKWEFDVKAEGDAPLVTIDEVVRGVVRRSGDAFHAERITGDQFRAIVSGHAAPTSAPASPPLPDTPRPDTAPV